MYTNIRLRIISAIVILIAFLFGLLYSKYFFLCLMCCVFIGMAHEWRLMCENNTLYRIFGFSIFAISCISLIIARFVEQGYSPLLIYFIIIWTVDTMALIGGKTIGGIKLAPKISPNKTWSGLLIGSLSSGLISYCFTYLPGYNFYIFNNAFIESRLLIFIFGFLLAIISQLSDLFMSFFKRKFKVKDSGNMIPGHGGMIDRFDSIILTAPIILYILLL
jgi:phosphatidate cytidylyltransferase